jgi:dihydrofolate reductase
MSRSSATSAAGHASTSRRISTARWREGRYCRLAIQSEPDAVARYFLIGRVTYELLHKTWGNIKGGSYLDRMNEIRKLVASTTRTGPLPWNATVINGDVAAEIARLKREPGGDIEVYGSATLVQTLMRHNLIDEYRIHVHPIVLGGGTQLFPQGGVSATLQLTGTRTLDSGVVSLTYVPTGRD